MNIFNDIVTPVIFLIAIIMIIVLSVKNKSLRTSIESLKTSLQTTKIELEQTDQKYSSALKHNAELLEMKKRLDSEIEKKNRKILLLESFTNTMKSNLTAFPYMAGIVADIQTYGLEKLALRLDWGYNQQREKKVMDIRAIRRNAKEMIAQAKEAEYQLKYLLQLYPGLEDIIETEFSELPDISLDDASEIDRVRDYLSKEEYTSLSETEKNQLALDRYLTSHKKTNWQIGRDYENFVGFLCTRAGYTVDYYGSYMKLEDLGRDIIAEKNGHVMIIQCKYWSKQKVIHEKHITQLYGTMISYCIENNISETNVEGILYTNTTLSETAKKMAEHLGIEYAEHFEMKEFPCIKCNIGKDEYGYQTKIYHLPFDQMYDSVKINKPGEFFAMTVKEAEDAGFRRAWRWHGD